MSGTNTNTKDGFMVSAGPTSNPLLEATAQMKGDPTLAGLTVVPQRQRPEQQSGSVQFPWRLHELLTEAETNGNEVIISWLHGTNAFKVHNKIRFTNEILPAYFNATKYKSFQRNLNLWGFETIQEGPNKGGCFHPLFLKNDREKCHYMTRQKVKGNQSKGGVKADMKPLLDSAGLVAGKAPLSALADLASRAPNSSLVATTIDQSHLPSSRIDDLKALSFPRKLHHILAQNRFNECMCWTPDGRCIRVVDPFKFQEKVAVAYFDYTSFTSFLVELESYGFKKVSHAGFQECYYHDFMIRGCAHLSKYMPDPQTSRRFTSNDPQNDLKVDAAFGVLPTVLQQQSAAPMKSLNSMLGNSQTSTTTPLLSPDAAAGALVQEIQHRQQLAALQLIAGSTSPATSNGLGAALGLGGLGSSLFGGVAAVARRSSIPPALSGLSSTTTTATGKSTSGSAVATTSGGTASSSEDQAQPSNNLPISSFLATSSQGSNGIGSTGRSEAV